MNRSPAFALLMATAMAGGIPYDVPSYRVYDFTNRRDRKTGRQRQMRKRAAIAKTSRRRNRKNKRRAA